MNTQTEIPVFDPSSIIFEISPAAPNVLHVPSEMREYISEKGKEGRSFNLESFAIHHDTDPDRVLVGLMIGKKGAELLEPFTVTLSMGHPAAEQLTQALNGELQKERSGSGEPASYPSGR